MMRLGNDLTPFPVVTTEVLRPSSYKGRTKGRWARLLIVQACGPLGKGAWVKMGRDMGEIVDDRMWSRRSVGQMYFPQFLVGMVATLLVILGWTYTSTGSAWAALGWTVLAAVILQAGYFAAVLWLVHGETRVTDETKSNEGAASPAKLPGPFERDGIIQALISRLFPRLP